MSAALALRYERQTPQHRVQVTVPRGAVAHIHLSAETDKSHFVTAVLKARSEADEALELFGQSAATLRPRERAELRRRVGAVSPIVGLISNLNAWENISLPAAYHGAPPLEQVAQLAGEVLTTFGADAQQFFARLPDELTTLERKITAFIRLLVSAPELLVLDALEEGLSHAECRQAAHFELIYRAYQPAGTVLYVDTGEDA